MKIYDSSRKVSSIKFAWGLAGILFIMFVTYKIQAKAILQTAECLYHKSPDSYTDWLTHIAQFVYRIIFKTCDHDYR